MAVAENKKRVPITLEDEVANMIAALVNTKKYYNRSHVVEQAVRALAKTELNGLFKKKERVRK